MTSSSDSSSVATKKVSPDDVRTFLLENPDFLEENGELLGALLPLGSDNDEGVQDFQRYRLAKLQDDFIALKAENEDLMDLMQEHLQRQNRINAAILALMDAPDFESTIHLICQDFPALLDQEAVGLFLEAGGWLEQGDYNGLKVVSPGLVGRWLSGRESALEEALPASSDVFGDKAKAVHSQALIRIVMKEGLPPGLLALGHRDPVHYATGLATEQVECLAGVVERCLRKWLV